jgi:hypothetical protein
MVTANEGCSAGPIHSIAWGKHRLSAAPTRIAIRTTMGGSGVARRILICCRREPDQRPTATRLVPWRGHASPERPGAPFNVPLAARACCGPRGGPRALGRSRRSAGGPREARRRPTRDDRQVRTARRAPTLVLRSMRTGRDRRAVPRRRPRARVRAGCSPATQLAARDSRGPPRCYGRGGLERVLTGTSAHGLRVASDYVRFTDPRERRARGLSAPT